MMRLGLTSLCVAACVWLNLHAIGVCRSASIDGGVPPAPIVAILSLYVLCDADTALIRNRRSTALFRLLWGFSAMMSLLLLTGRLGSHLAGKRLEILSVSFAIATLALYNFGNTIWGAAHLAGRHQWPLPRPNMSRWRYVIQRAAHDFAFPVIALIAASGALGMTWSEWATCRPLVTFAVLTSVLAIECIRQGLEDTKHIRRESETFWCAARRSGGVRLGAILLVVWAATFVSSIS